jgi:hypothetical protein
LTNASVTEARSDHENDSSGVHHCRDIRPDHASSDVFLEQVIGLRNPPAITHSEYFYGFLMVAVTWQVMFILISIEPDRLSPAIPVAALEKIGFAGVIAVLFVQHRVGIGVGLFACVDLALGVLMLAAWRNVLADPQAQARLRPACPG